MGYHLSSVTRRGRKLKCPRKFPTAARIHQATATRPTQMEGTLTQTTIRVEIRLVRTTTPEMDIPFTRAAMERLSTKTPTRVSGATATLDLDLGAKEDRARSSHLQRQPSGFELFTNLTINNLSYFNQFFSLLYL